MSYLSAIRRPETQGSKCKRKSLSQRNIVTILGHTITGIKTTERTLSLIFDNEYTLVLHDDEDYDAFAIDYGDRTIVV